MQNISCEWLLFHPKCKNFPANASTEKFPSDEIHQNPPLYFIPVAKSPSRQLKIAVVVKVHSKRLFFTDDQIKVHKLKSAVLRTLYSKSQVIQVDQVNPQTKKSCIGKSEFKKSILKITKNSGIVKLYSKSKVLNYVQIKVPKLKRAILVKLHSKSRFSKMIKSKSPN